ncbi:MAG: tRNA wybutosine-synthesizing 3 family protein [Nanoarchaeota archaeon]|nr:tRNA wybutosine-synthesizing 3 family protein [Nanoarchaeota archaeon]
MSFEHEKKNVLDKIIYFDKSKKGLVDKEIISLVKEINNKKDYYTTSSCAGRIFLIKTSESGRKDESEWLLASHDKIGLEQLKNALGEAVKYDNESWFKQESMIMHIACRTAENAEELLHIVRCNVGLKRAGIISLKRNILEIIGADSIYTLVAKDKKILVDDYYLNLIVGIANKKMDINNKRIALLYKEIKKL